MFSDDLPPGFTPDPVDFRVLMRDMIFQHRLNPDTHRCRSCNRLPESVSKLCTVARIALERLQTNWPG